MNKSGLILLITDSGSDAYRLEQAFQKAGLIHPVRVARRAEEVYCYLQGIGIYQDRENYPLPVLMIVDLSIPNGEGFEIVRWLKQQASLPQISLIGIGAAQSNQTIQAAFDEGIVGYFEKPTDFVDLAEALSQMEALEERAAFQPTASSGENLRYSEILP